ncbi:hypothetical protein Taro_005645 [Colocasia esculenta]|uniref:Uncharacterized protein n=1 Tax=Colocasia esculenta TaxID=4460 RepID=A0A843TQH5_COLES|nr:hypothetical protein [Colocasia esculenta]
MPPQQERLSNPCVYIISCLLLITIIGGGVLLMLYVILPENEETAWFPIAGMLLVGTPWVFWILTFLYRTVSMGLAAHREGATSSATAPPAPPAAAAIDGDLATADALGGAQQVHVGGDPNGDCSSQISHESELPLFAKP